MTTKTKDSPQDVYAAIRMAADVLGKMLRHQMGDSTEEPKMVEVALAKSACEKALRERRDE